MNKVRDDDMAYFTVEQGYLRVKPMSGGRTTCLGKTPAAVATALAKWMKSRRLTVYTMNSMCSSSVDFSEEHGLPDAGEILNAAMQILVDRAEKRRKSSQWARQRVQAWQEERAKLPDEKKVDQVESVCLLLDAVRKELGGQK